MIKKSTGLKKKKKIKKKKKKKKNLCFKNVSQLKEVGAPLLLISFSLSKMRRSIGSARKKGPSDYQSSKGFKRTTQF